MPFSLLAGYSVGNTDPIDARFVVPTVADLTTQFSNSTVYEGLLVYVQDTNQYYSLTDASLWDDPTLLGWTIVGNQIAVPPAGPIGSVQYRYNTSYTSGSENLLFVSASNTLVLTGSFSQGTGSVANGAASHAEGDRSSASGYASHAEGYYSTASAIWSHAEGFGTYASQTGSHAEGYQAATGVHGYNSISTVNGLITLDSSYGNVVSQFPASSTGPGGTILAYKPVFFADKIYSISQANVSFNGTNTTIQLADETVNVGPGVGVNLLKNGPSTNATFQGGKYSHAEGRSFAIGDYSHAEGLLTVAKGSYTHTEGAYTLATTQMSHAEGYFTIANGSYSHTEGEETVTEGIASHAEGAGSQAIGRASHAEGLVTQAIGLWSHTEGDNSAAYGTGSHAEGYITRAGLKGYLVDDITNYTMSLAAVYGDVSAEFPITTFTIGPTEFEFAGDLFYTDDTDTLPTLAGVLGNRVLTPKHPLNTGNPTVYYEGGKTRILLTTTLNDYGVNTNGTIAGNAVIAPTQNANPSGSNITIQTQYGHAEGYSTAATGTGSHAEGYETFAYGKFSHAEGYKSIATGEYSHVEGYQSIAKGDYSHAQGYQTIASGSHTYARGSNVIAIGTYSSAEGESTVSSGNYAHAEGSNTIASGSYSHTEGQSAQAYGYSSHAEGFATKTFDDYAHAEGYQTSASGEWSHAEGRETEAKSRGTHAEGISTYAGFASGVTIGSSGNYAHAEGNSTRAVGFASHAEGALTLASNEYAHAQGVYVTASGIGSFAGGGATRATTNFSTALGIKNLTTEGLLIIGNGTDGFNPEDANRSDLAVFQSDKIILSQSIYLPDVQLTPDSSGRKYVLVNTANGKLEYSAATPGGGGGGGGDITDVNPGLGISILNSAGPEPEVSLDTGSAHFTTGVSASVAGLNLGSNITINNNVDNRILTATGNQALEAESNLTFNGSVLSVTGQVSATGVTGSLFSVRAGAAPAGNFAGSPLTASINVAMGTTNYRVSVIGQDARVWSVQNKTANGFVINTNSTEPLTLPVDWMAVLDNS